MIPRLLTLAALVGTLSACTSTDSASLLPQGTAAAPAQSAALPDGSLVTASLAPPTGAAAGHVDAPGAAPHSHDGQPVYGVPGDPKQPARTVEIAMSETDDGQMIFTPNAVQTKAGEQIRFKIRNVGELDHEFVLATTEANKKHGLSMQKNPDMEHDDPNAVRLAAGEAGEILWKFTNTGEFEFACLIPGHRESGMVGRAAVS